MNKYEGCHELNKIVGRFAQLVWCNKLDFARSYQKYTNLPIKTCLSILTEVNKKYQIVWYHTKGFIFHIHLITQVKNFKFTLDWGDYYLLFNVDYPSDFVSVGGNYKIWNGDGIHANIYTKRSQIGYNINKICVNPQHSYANSKLLVQSGNILAHIDQMVGYLTSNDGNGLFDYFHTHAYNKCQYCGDYVNLNETICDTCTKK